VATVRTENGEILSRIAQILPAQRNLVAERNFALIRNSWAGEIERRLSTARGRGRRVFASRRGRGGAQILRSAHTTGQSDRRGNAEASVKE